MRVINDDRIVLTHYGVKGMRWGIRKERESTGRTRREKAANVLRVQRQAKDKNLADIAAANWMSKSISEKLFNTMMIASLSAIAGVAVTKFANPALLQNPKFIALVAKKVVTQTLVQNLTKEVTSKSAMKRYTDSGEKDRSKKQYKYMTPELAIQRSVKLAQIYGPILKQKAGESLKKAYMNKMANQARVDKWGQNILPKKTSEYHTIYDDGYMSILEKIKG